MLFHYNQLAGPIPAELGSLSNLSSLSLSSNMLTGKIQWPIGEPASLQSVHPSSNNLSDCIPPSLGRVATNDLAGLRLSDYTKRGPAPAPTTLSASLTDGAFSLSCSTVTGAAKCEMGYQKGGSSSDWESMGATKAAALTTVLRQGSCVASPAS